MQDASAIGFYLLSVHGVGELSKKNEKITYLVEQKSSIDK